MNKKKEKESVKKGKKRKLLSTQRYLELAEIHDNTIVLKDGGLRSIIEVSSINFNLKSEEEQNSIIYGYQSFLNSLNFPVQILVKSKKLDIDNYVNNLKLKVKNEENQLLRKQMIEYIQYIKKLVEFSDIMKKEFFVIIPQNPLAEENKSMWKSFLQKISPDDKVIKIIERKKAFKNLKKELEEKVNVIKTGLQNCGVQGTQLRTERLIEIFYQVYNPQLSRAQKINHIEDFAMAQNNSDNLIPEQ